MREKYLLLKTDAKHLTDLMGPLQNKLRCEDNQAMEAPISMGELEAALKRGRANKAPGCDKISTEFFTFMWDMIKSDILCTMNEMFIDGEITEAQKKGFMICVPKRNIPCAMPNYRPITLLNADYKLLTRTIAHRLQP